MHQALDDAMEHELYEELEGNLEDQAGADVNITEEVPEVENDLDTEVSGENIHLDGEQDHSIVNKNTKNLFFYSL